jgi:hypothetical protein
MNFFLAGSDLIRWHLEVVDSVGGAHHVRLTMQHPRGSIIELIAARGFGNATTVECAQ